jgi:hypothetical protein
MIPLGPVPSISSPGHAPVACLIWLPIDPAAAAPTSAWRPLVLTPTPAPVALGSLIFPFNAPGAELTPIT